MACNCASQEQIEKLHNLYGHKVNPGIKKTLKFTINNIITYFFVALAIILLSPFLLGYVCYIGLFSKDGKISVREFLGMKRGEDGAYAKYIDNNDDGKIKGIND